MSGNARSPRCFINISTMYCKGHYAMARHQTQRAGMKRKRCFQSERTTAFFFFLVVISLSFIGSSCSGAEAVHSSRWFNSYSKVISWDALPNLDAFNQTIDHLKVDQSLSVLSDINGRKRQRIDKLWEVMDLVSSSIIIVRGGARESHTPSQALSKPNTTVLTLNDLDSFLGRLATILGWFVAFQSVGTFVTSNDHAYLDEMASKFLSAETAKAVQTVRKIITRFPDHGVETDIFSQYSPKEVTASIWALSRLQQASNLHEVANSACAIKEGDLIDPQLVDDLAHYAVFATAAYGWKGALAFRGKIHMGGNLEAVLAKTGVDRDHLISAHWASRTHRPVYFMVKDVERRKIVLCIRGTLSARDVLTDLCCTAEDFVPHGNNTSKKTMHNSRAHHGMLEAARAVDRMTQRTVAAQMAENPDYGLVLIGHSLGGGVAAVLGTLWQDLFPDLMVYSYGCPCVGPLNTKPTENMNIVSVVGEGDPFSCLSLGHIADISAALSRLCEEKGLRDDILDRTQGRLDEMNENDISWCATEMGKLRNYMQGEKFFPSGKILHVAFGPSNDVSMRQVSADFFRDLPLHPRMFDLTRHVPGRYEQALARLRTDTPSNC